MNKTCKKCELTKSAAEFYLCGNGKYRQGTCKACYRARVAQWKRDNPAKVRQANDKWAAENPEKKAAMRSRYNAKNKYKRKAHDLLSKAVNRGQITKPERCEHCGQTGRIHGHHDDYAKPLDVAWLCHPCHMLIHRNTTNG